MSIPLLTIYALAHILHDLDSRNKLPVLSHFQFWHAHFFKVADFSDVPILKLKLQKLLLLVTRSPAER